MNLRQYAQKFKQPQQQEMEIIQQVFAGDGKEDWRDLGKGWRDSCEWYEKHKTEQVDEIVDSWEQQAKRLKESKYANAYMGFPSLERYTIPLYQLQRLLLRLGLLNECLQQAMRREGIAQGSTEYISIPVHVIEPQQKGFSHEYLSSICLFMRVNKETFLWISCYSAVYILPCGLLKLEFSFPDRFEYGKITQKPQQNHS